MSTERDSEKNGLPFELGVFDLDGTVMRRDLRITGRTVAALDRLRERGVRLVVATGRRFEGACDHTERLGFVDRDPLICYGGSMVRRMNGKPFLPYRNLWITSSMRRASSRVASSISFGSGR